MLLTRLHRHEAVTHPAAAAEGVVTLQGQVQRSDCKAFLQLADLLEKGVLDRAPAAICNHLLDPHRRRKAMLAAQELANARSASYRKSNFAGTQATSSSQASPSRNKSDSSKQSPALALQFGSMASPSRADSSKALTLTDTILSDATSTEGMITFGSHPAISPRGASHEKALGSGVDVAGGSISPRQPLHNDTSVSNDEASLETVTARVLQQPARFGDFGSKDEQPQEQGAAMTELIDSYFALLRKASEAFGTLQAGSSCLAAVTSASGQLQQAVLQRSTRLAALAWIQEKPLLELEEDLEGFGNDVTVETEVCSECC